MGQEVFVGNGEALQQANLGLSSEGLAGLLPSSSQMQNSHQGQYLRMSNQHWLHSHTPQEDPIDQDATLLASLLYSIPFCDVAFVRSDHPHESPLPAESFQVHNKFAHCTPEIKVFSHFSPSG
jgi:hypothetical protein